MLQITGAQPDQPVWLALAAPVPEPWSEDETAFIEMRDVLVNDELHAVVNNAEGIGSPMQFFLPPHTQVRRMSLSALQCLGAGCYPRLVSLSLQRMLFYSSSSHHACSASDIQAF